MSYKGIIFDMDGVLVDTESLKAESHSDTTASLGRRVDKLLYVDLLGKSFGEVAGVFLEKAGINCSIEDYRRIFNQKYKIRLQNEVKIKQGVKEFLVLLKDKNIPMALVTSSQEWMASLILSKLGVQAFFKHIVSSEDVINEKPLPEPYEKALGKIQLRGNECLAFEDSESGIISAVSAGLTVFGIRHEYNLKQDFSLAKAEFYSLSEVEICDLT